MSERTWNELGNAEGETPGTLPTLPPDASATVAHERQGGAGETGTPAARQPRTEAGDRIAHFDIAEEIGQGATGRVFLARDTRLGRAVALKLMLRHDAASRERFEREARAVARLQHQNIVSIYDVAEHDGQPYIVEEYVGGSSLAACARPMPWQEVLALGLGLANGLAAAHARGVLHRDIKPANIMVTAAGVPKLVDFGLAKLAEPDSEVDADTGEMADKRTNRGAPKRDKGNRDARKRDKRTNRGAGSRDKGNRDAGKRDKGNRDARKRDLTRSGAVIGTPYYMAPELWQSTAATPASDVYALGVVLYELCTGRVPYHDVPVADLQRVVVERDAPALARAMAHDTGAAPNPPMDQRLAAVIERCLAREPAARFASGQALHTALAAIAPLSTVPAALAENPYPGLRAFDRDHRAYFFGRDADIRDVAARLEREHMILIAGESGVGKSSLLRAGVLPWIAERGLAGSSAWWTCTWLPDQHALVALSTALSPRLGMDARALRSALTHDLAAVGARLQRVHGDDAGTVIFVDQLEQLVSLCAGADAAATATALDYLAAQVPRVRVVATVRGDQLTRLAHLPGLGPRIERALYILRPLGQKEVREAVLRPAASCGVDFESTATVDALAQATLRASGGLPLLQFALSQLWAHRDEARRRIPAAALDAIGGVEGALARHADQVVDGLRSARAAREVLLRLVLLHEMRARHAEEALVAGDEDRRKALEALVQGRLVVASETEGAPVYEIAHEALLTGWPRLRHWLDEQGERRAVQRRLAFAAAEWQRLGRSREALWQARRLREAANIDADVLGPTESAFLFASRQEVRRARRLRRMAVMLPFLLLASIYGGVRYEQERRLRAEVDALMNRALPFLTEAQAMHERYQRLRDAAEVHLRAGEREAGEAAWQQALALGPRIEATLIDASRPLELAFRRDLGRPDVRARLARVLHGQALLAEAMGRNATRARLVAQLDSLDDAGDLVARWTAARPVAVETTPEGLPVTLHRYVEQPDGTLDLVAHGAAQTTPHTWQLVPGSYLLMGAHGQPGDIRYPFLVAPGNDREDLHIDVSAQEHVPEGFAHVPAGWFVYGFGGDEMGEIMRDWYNATPPHPRHTSGFFIGRHETTYAQWIAFLRALPPEARKARMPRADFDPAHVSLSARAGQLELTLRPVARTYRAAEGLPIVYAKRDRRQVQDWLRFPVTGISGEDANTYMEWLDRTGQVPGARLCREDEWERAARGADARLFPHGNRLKPDDANFDATYGKQDDAFGFDEAGSHPASRSPFGVDDLTGNARELTRALGDEPQLVLRGGDFFRTPRNGAVVNRQVITAAQRIPHLGLRVCADAPASASRASPRAHR